MLRVPWSRYEQPTFGDMPALKAVEPFLPKTPTITPPTPAKVEPQPTVSQPAPFSQYLEQTAPTVSSIQMEETPSEDYEALTRQYATRYGIVSDLAVWLVRQESGFNPTATSPVGAAGLTQLMPATARSLGVEDIFDPHQNLDAGMRYLRQQLDRYGGDYAKALAGYNAGPGRVDREIEQRGQNWEQGLPAETQRYLTSWRGTRPRLEIKPSPPAPIAPAPITPSPVTEPSFPGRTQYPFFEALSRQLGQEPYPLQPLVERLPTFVKKGLAETTPGLVAELAGKPLFDIPEEYQPNLLESIGSAVISFAADPVTYLSFGVGSVAGKLAAKQLMAMGAKRAIPIAGRAIGGAVGLGAYQAARQPFEAKEFVPEEIARAGLKGAVLGGTAGVAGGLAAPLGQVAATAAEIGAFGALGPTVEAGKPTMPTPDAFIGAAGVILGIKASTIIGRSLWRLASGAKLAPSEAKSIRNVSPQDRALLGWLAQNPVAGGQDIAMWWDAAPVPERSAIAQKLGIGGQEGPKSWEMLDEANRVKLTEGFAPIKMAPGTSVQVGLPGMGREAAQAKVKKELDDLLTVEVPKVAEASQPPVARVFKKTTDLDPEWSTVATEIGVPSVSLGRRPITDDILYHFTPTSNLSDVAKNGLRPGTTEGFRQSFQERARFYRDNYGVNIPKNAVYAADNAGILSSVDRDVGESMEWTLLRFKAGQRTWRIDPEFAKTDKGAWYTTKDVKTSEIEFLGSDGRWHPMQARAGRKAKAPQPPVAEVKGVVEVPKVAEASQLEPARLAKTGEQLSRTEFRRIAAQPITEAPSWPRLVRAYKSFMKDLFFGIDDAELNADIVSDPASLLTAHASVMSAKSSRAQTLRRLADQVFAETGMPRLPEGKFRGENGLDFDTLAQRMGYTLEVQRPSGNILYRRIARAETAPEVVSPAEAPQPDVTPLVVEVTIPKTLEDNLLPVLRGEVPVETLEEQIRKVYTPEKADAIREALTTRISGLYDQLQVREGKFVGEAKYPVAKLITREQFDEVMGRLNTFFRALNKVEAVEVKAEVPPTAPLEPTTLGEAQTQASDVIKQAVTKQGLPEPTVPPPLATEVTPPPPPRRPGVKEKPLPPPPTDPVKSAADMVFGIPGESNARAALRKHDGAMQVEGVAQERVWKEGQNLLRTLGFGKARGEYQVVSREEAESLYRVLRDEQGAEQLSPKLRTVYDRLMELMKQETADMLAFDPTFERAVLAHPDYFPSMWKIPKETRVAPALGARPFFKKARSGATFDELLEAGFEPISWNPFDLAVYRRLAGIQYRQDQILLQRLKSFSLALPSYEAPSTGWRVPRVGAAFEGKPFATKEGEVMFTPAQAVPNSLADAIEGIRGIRPRISIGGVDILGGLRQFSTAAKRIKLFASLFQHIDFGLRAGGVYSMPSGWVKGNPLRYPSVVTDMMQATFSSGYRERLAAKLISDKPLRTDPTISLKMIVEEGWQVGGDPSILRRGIQSIIEREIQAPPEGATRQVLAAAQKRADSIPRFFEDGLFGGVYRVAQSRTLEDVIVPRLRKMHPEWTDRQIAGSAAEEVNKMFSSLGEWQTVFQQPAMKSLARSLLFSTNETESWMRQGLSLFKGQNKRLWQDYYVGLFLFLAGLANAINILAEGEPLPLEAYSPIKVGDRYAVLPGGISYNTRFLSPKIPWAKGADGRDLYLDVIGQADTFLRWILNAPGALASRLDIIPRAVVNQVSGESYFGEPIVTPTERLKHAAMDVFLPISAGSALGAAREVIPELAETVPPVEPSLGVAGGLLQATGVNIRAAGMREIIDAEAQRLTGKNWDDLSASQQRSLRAKSKIIVEAEAIRKTEAGQRFLRQGQIDLRAQVEAGRNVQKQLSPEVRKELERLGLEVGTLNRTLTVNKQSFVLNDARYKNLQKLTAQLIDKAIRPYVTSPGWAKGTDQLKVTTLQKQITKARDTARDQLVRQIELEARGIKPVQTVQPTSQSVPTGNWAQALLSLQR